MHLKYRFIILITCLLVLGFFSCTDKINASQKLIEDHFKLLNEHNLKELAKQYSNKVTIVSPDVNSLPGSPKSLLRKYELYFTYCTDVEFKIKEIIVQDSLVVVQYEIIGSPVKYSPTTTNFYPHGIHDRNCTVFKIKDNKIINEDIYIDDKYYID